MATQRAIRFLTLLVVLSVCGQAVTFSRCDVNQSGATDVLDVKALINQASGAAPTSNDLNDDGRVDVVDVQIDTDAALGLGCAADPHLLSIVPNTGQRGVSGISVTITGAHTNFTNSSVISLGAGITVTGVAAANATTLTATLAIDAAAANTTRDLTVDGLTLPGGFTVTLPSSVEYTYDSQGRLTTATYTSTTGSVIVVNYTYDAAGNRTAVVAH
jgi:hypothetical protein